MRLRQEILYRRIEAATPGKMLTIRRTTISLFVLSGNLILSRFDLFIWYSFQSKKIITPVTLFAVCAFTVKLTFPSTGFVSIVSI